MADVAHATLTGSDLHEPKGVSSAIPDTVYIADGLGGGTWDTQGTLGKLVTVQVESDFPAAVGTVITLAANTVYRMVKDITTINTFIFNNNSVLIGLDETVVKLTYNGTGTLITASDASFKVEKLKIDCPNATLLSAKNTVGNEGTSTGIFNWFWCESVDTLGTSQDMAAIAFVHSNLINITTTGLTFSGVGCGTLIIDSAVFVQGAGTTFDFGTAVFSVGPVIGDSSFVLAAAATGLSGLTSSGNITSGAVGNVKFNRFTGGGTSISGLSSDDTRWNFVGNNNIPNSHPDGMLSIVGPATATISTTNTPVKIAGTWVVEHVSQFTGSTSGRLTYNGEKSALSPVNITVTAEPSAGTNIAFTFYVAKNGGIISRSGTATYTDAGNTKNTAVLWLDTLTQNDYIEIWVENNTDTADIVVSTAILRVG